MPANKLYSTKEIKTLFERATELQKNQNASPDEGLTLEELEQIAADSGIDPNYIRQAITEQHIAPSGKSGFHILGAPLSLEVGREIAKTMTADDWELIVQEARRTFKKSGGSVQKLGNSLEWMSPDQKVISASITATPSAKGTRFFAGTHFGKVAFMTYYFSFVILMLTLFTGIGQSNLPLLTSLGIILAGAATVFGGIRYLFGKWVNHYKNKLDKMFSRFELILNKEQTSANQAEIKQSESLSPSILIPDEVVPNEDISIKRKHKSSN